MAIAVKTVPASQRQGEGTKKEPFVAGRVRVAVLSATTAAHLGGFGRSNAGPDLGIITVTWPNGTFHGVSAKHLLRYARECDTASIAAGTSPVSPASCSRQRLPAQPSPVRQLVKGAQPNRALPALTG
jgi:hypothetical protein